MPRAKDSELKIKEIGMRRENFYPIRIRFFLLVAGWICIKQY